VPALVAFTVAQWSPLTAIAQPDATPNDAVEFVDEWRLAEHPASPSFLQFTGNYVFNAATYMSVLILPTPPCASPELAAEVQNQLLHFLRSAGYVLARVSVRVVSDHLEVAVDEGRLDKILFLGTGTLQALRLKLELSVPHHVFNKPDLEQQLQALSARFGLTRLRYQLAIGQSVEHVGPQLEDLGDLYGVAIIPPEVRFVLFIRVEETEWNTGLGLSAAIKMPDGLRTGLDYRGVELFAAKDRWQVGADIGVRLRTHLENNASYLSLSRADVEARWYMPPLVFAGLRPFLWLGNSLTSDQRRDLALEIFYRNLAEGSLNVGYELVPGLMLSGGGGAEEKSVFGVDQLDAPANDPGYTPIEPFNTFHPFVHANLEFTFNQEEMRRDRSHALRLDSRHYWLTDASAFNAMHFNYRKVLALGWHDVELGARAAFLVGNIEFDLEEPVGGRYLRGVFGDRYHVKRVAAVSAEIRWSLARDLYKIGLFHDLAAFGALNRLDGLQQARFGNSFGPSFHALVMDLFQLNLYYGFGFCSDGAFDRGFSGSLSKAF